MDTAIHMTPDHHVASAPADKAKVEIKDLCFYYGASKALLTRYAQGLDHRLVGTGVKVVLIKPGPTDTAMTTHMKEAGKRLATAEDVARATVDAIRRGKRVVYAPRLWQLIMLIVRHLPRPILNRLPI